MEYNPQDCHKYLQIEQTATLSEAEERYKELKAKYSEDRFKEGEEGRLGAVNLMNLEQAYKDFCTQRKEQKSSNSGSDVNLDEIDDLIKSNKLDQAQSALDNISARSAKWHYLQAIVFYKRGWFSECRTQLKLAVNLEPANQTFSGALERLDNEMGGSIRFEQGSDGRYRPAGAPLDNSMGLNNCCSWLCLLPCCCC